MAFIERAFPGVPFGISIPAFLGIGGNAEANGRVLSWLGLIVKRFPTQNCYFIQ
jgi:hypothetical protein